MITQAHPKYLKPTPYKNNSLIITGGSRHYRSSAMHWNWAAQSATLLISQFLVT